MQLDIKVQANARFLVNPDQRLAQETVMLMAEGIADMLAAEGYENIRADVSLSILVAEVNTDHVVEPRLTIDEELAEYRRTQSNDLHPK